MGRLAHAFLSAGHDDLGIAELQRLITQGDRAKARAANLIDPKGRGLEGNTCGDRGLDGRDFVPRPQ